uniref:MADF domain-containing protein n=1 Tax=Steinernema glaseri TaxID=37863 RepID=A0A1I7ZMG0_9BILA
MKFNALKNVYLSIPLAVYPAWKVHSLIMLILVVKGQKSQHSSSGPGLGGSPLNHLRDRRLLSVFSVRTAMCANNRRGGLIEILLEEIERRPRLHLSRMSPDPAWQDDWSAVVFAVQQSFPEATYHRIWKTWYYMRYNYFRDNVAQRWKPYLAFLGDPKHGYKEDTRHSRRKSVAPMTDNAPPQEAPLLKRPIPLLPTSYCPPTYLSSFAQPLQLPTSSTATITAAASSSSGTDGRSECQSSVTVADTRKDDEKSEHDGFSKANAPRSI